MPRPIVARWLRRALEAAIAAAAIAVAALVGGLGQSAQPVAIPVGPAGLLAMAPATLALAVLPVGYPVGMAATRSDALFGAAAAFLIAADATILLAGQMVDLGASGAARAGLLAATLALPGAVVGLLAGQVATPLGFGRRAGALTAATAAAIALAALAAAGAMVQTG